MGQPVDPLKDRVLTWRVMAWNTLLAAWISVVGWQIGWHPAFVVLAALVMLFPWSYWRDIRRRLRSRK